MSRFRHLISPANPDDWVSLGEGDTPLVPSRFIGPELGLERLYFKVEGVNPTGSFKDRYVAATIAMARHLGYRRAVVSSTGNLGVSAAAYAAAAGLDLLFVCLPGTPPAILAQARLHGATMIETEPAIRQEVFERLAARDDVCPVGLFLERPVQNPYGVEGYRAIAWEIVEELDQAPGAVLFPCARGNGLFGAWKGFVDAVAWGWAGDVPRMVGCQPRGAHSLRVSLEKGAVRAVELPPVDSVAFSAAETIASDGALRAIRASGGTALSVADEAIGKAVADLGREGLCVEPASALPVACLPQFLEDDPKPVGPVVCVLTGAGIKWPDALPGEGPPLPRVRRLEDLDAVVAAVLRADRPHRHRVRYPWPWATPRFSRYCW